ncbi:MAG: hypothetical protein ABIM89_09815 [Mycobacteriales bacterium]
MTAIDAGDSHSVAPKADGTVVSWGSQAPARLIPPVGLTGVTLISAGREHTLAVTTSTRPTAPTNVEVTFVGGTVALATW